MDFDLNDEQKLLKENVERLALACSRLTGVTSKRAENAWDAAAWARFADMGLLGLPFAENEGGFGGGSVELMIVAEAMGRHLCLLPYNACIALAGSLLRFGATAEQRERLLPRISDGRCIPAFAYQEPTSRYDFADVQTTARRSGAGWILNGHKSGVVAGDSANAFVVSARTSGSRFDQDGIGLFWVDGDTPGLLKRSYVAQDDTGGAEILLSDVAIAPELRIDAVDHGYNVIERASEIAMAASLAECVGVMDAMLTITTEYLKTRRQFGKRIGEFQALQHRAADMLVASELARSMAIYAASMAGSSRAHERRKAIAAAKVQVSESLSFVASNAVQLHGGIGVTEECAIGPYFKRATVLEMFLGDCDHHLARFVASDGFT